MSPTPSCPSTRTDHVTGRRGHLVVDRLVRGVASGGLRMREGCTVDEVAGLARGMTMKEALHYDPAARYVPLGGAKGGIDCDPRSPEATASSCATCGPCGRTSSGSGRLGSLGLTQDLVDRAAADAGLVSSVQAVFPLLDDEAAARKRLADAFAIEVDGIGLNALVGGLGVAESALVALDRAGRERAGPGCRCRDSARWAARPPGSWPGPGCAWWPSPTSGARS
ncbi:glutamate dehydrogenase [Streptomyces narbonensis]